jgi:hypothetical protein
MPVRGKITAAAVGGLLAAGLPSGVAGAEPGLTVDPQSPAGVEYAIPLDSGRGHGGGHGHSGGGSGGGGSPALFGSGITPPGKGGSGTSPSGSGTGMSGGGGAHNGGTSGGATSHGSPNARSVADATPPGIAPASAAASYSTSGPIAGIVAAILVLGGGVGLFLRFRARRATSQQQIP